MISWLTTDFISFVVLGKRQEQITPIFTTLQGIPMLDVQLNMGHKTK
jgi:hypothetical protein